MDSKEADAGDVAVVAYEGKDASDASGEASSEGRGNSGGGGASHFKSTARATAGSGSEQLGADSGADIESAGEVALEEFDDTPAMTAAQAFNTVKAFSKTSEFLGPFVQHIRCALEVEEGLRSSLRCE